jgi:TonB family protein
LKFTGSPLIAMVSTISSVGLQGKPESLVEAMGDFACGALSLKDIRQVLAEELRNNPSCGGVIHEYLDAELQARRLSAADHNELMAGKDAALSVNIPNEASEYAPSEQGIYHLDDEGTLILSDDEKVFEAPTAAYDSVNSPGRNADGKTVGEDTQKILQQKKDSKIKPGYLLRDRFRLDQEIARGSMGVVYKAVDLLKQDAGAADPCVAVKLISPEFASHRSALKTFQNEIANTQLLSHPNIIHLFELDRDGDNYFITMEWLEGESLDALLDRSQGSALPPVQTYAIIEQLCDALAYAHERDVVHADVKPGNVFLVKTGELKLIDFGIARVDASLDDGKKKDGGLGVALTPAYASCERLEKSAPTPQDDLYALACMIYRLLSGRRVFGAMNALEAEKAGTEPVRIGGMNDVRWNALRQALSFRRHFRQASVNEFANKFGQRRTPRALGPEETSHTDTTTLEAMPAGTLGSDTTKLEQLNETANLQTLAGSDELNNSLPDASAAPAGGESPLDLHIQEFDEQPDTGGAKQDLMHPDTAKLEAQPEFGKVTPPAEEVEVPFVDTVNLDVAPEPINILDGDGLGFMPEADPAAAISVPADDVPEKSARAAPAPKAKQAKPAPVEEVVTRQKQQVTRQLRGGGQRQVVESRSFVARVITWPRDNPQIAAGTLLAGIAIMIGIGYMKSIGEPKPVPRAAAVRQSTMPVQRTTPISSADGEMGEAVMVDLTAPTGLIEPAPVEVNDDFVAVPVDLAAPVEAVSVEPDAELDAVPVELALPVGSLQASSAAVTVAPTATTPAITEQSLASETIAPKPVATPTPITPSAANAPLELPVNARKALADGRLVQPANDNASYWLEQMRTEGVDVPTLVEIEAELANALIQRAEDDYIAGDIDAAQGWIDLAERNGANEDELTPVRSAIAKLQLDNAASLAAVEKPAVNNPASSGQPASTGQTGVDSYETVALSKFEFIRYVEPEYPSQSTGRSVSGWVDVTFTVGKDGKPSDIQVIGSDLPNRFEAPSITAVKRWRFEPYAPNGLAEVAKSAVRLRYSN